MKKLVWMGAGAAVLLGVASASFAGPNVGGQPLGSFGREQAADRRLEAQPYALTGDNWTWELKTQKDPVRRNPGVFMKRVPAKQS